MNEDKKLIIINKENFKTISKQLLKEKKITQQTSQQLTLF
jgi:hypothetical protein